MPLFEHSNVLRDIYIYIYKDRIESRNHNIDVTRVDVDNRVMKIGRRIDQYDTLITRRPTARSDRRNRDTHR